MRITKADIDAAIAKEMFQCWYCKKSFSTPVAMEDHVRDVCAPARRERNQIKHWCLHYSVADHVNATCPRCPVLLSAQIDGRREPPTPVRLTAAERIELTVGAAALGETISATLRMGGLARARAGMRRQSRVVETAKKGAP